MGAGDDWIGTVRGAYHYDPEQRVTEQNAAEMWCGYAYVFDRRADGRAMMSILSPDRGGTPITNTWKCIVEIALNGTESGWDMLDKR